MTSSLAKSTTVRLAALVVSGVVLFLSPFAMRYVLLQIPKVVAMCMGRVAGSDPVDVDVGVVHLQGWRLWFRGWGMQWWTSFDPRSEWAEWSYDRIAREVQGWNLVRWIAIVIVSCLVAYGIGFSYHMRRRHLQNAEWRMSIRSVLPDVGRVWQTTRRMVLLGCGVSAAWCLIGDVTKYLLYVSFHSAGSMSATQSVLSFLQGWGYRAWPGRPEVALGIGFFTVGVSSWRLSRRVIVDICRSHPRVCRRCAYPLGPRGTVCPECGRVRSGRGSRRLVTPRTRQRARRVLRRTIIVATLNAVLFTGMTYALARVRLSPWFMRATTNIKEEHIEIAQYRFPVSVVYVRTDKPYVIRHAGQTWRATFSEVPLTTVGCKLIDSAGAAQEFEFDTSPQSQRTLPLVCCGDVKTLLTPRHDYGLPNDLPSGWIAVRIYASGVEFVPAESD